MKKLLLIAPLLLVGCMSTKNLDEAFAQLNDVRDEQLDVVDTQLETGEITPGEWVEARDEVFEADREARAALSKEVATTAGQEVRGWVDLVLYALLGVGGLGGGALVTAKGVRAVREKRATRS